MADNAVLILAAGKGERMRSERPKVLHPLGGKPLLSYSLKLAESLRPKKIVVLVGHKKDQIQKQFADKKVVWAVQKEQLGTAHAVLCGLEALRGHRGPLFILYADVPLLRLETLQEMQKIFLKEKASLVVLTARLDDPAGYGRILRDDFGNVQGIVEEKEADERQKEIREINTGVYLARAEELLKPLRRVKKSIVKGEFYLTDLVREFLREGKKVVTVTARDPEEVAGINSRAEIVRADGVLQRRIRAKWMEEGITLIDPETIRIEEEVELARDVVLHPGTILTGRTKIGAGAEILPYSVIEESTVGEEARVGPFAHLRPGSVVGAWAHVGNFVELKKTKLGKGAKANHLAYLGDAVVGSKVNIGAGTITCNYNGFEKHKTVIGEGAFIGSDTQFVAPVKIGKKAWIGAGTTVTKNVPHGALAVSRVEQKNILNWKRRK
jgi:bifunctional UDP-N-acetylglucosamine pyrophosphorylase/glucosamine-1-phosphate N-acetyltransferase